MSFSERLDRKPRSIINTRKSPRMETDGALGEPAQYAKHGHAERSISASAQQDDEERLADNFEIEDVRPVLDIMQVELNHLLMIQFAPPAHLPRAGEARHYLETTRIILGFEGEKLFTIAKL